MPSTGTLMVVPAFEKNQIEEEDEGDGLSIRPGTQPRQGLLGTIGLALVTLICFRLQVGLATAALLYLMIVVLDVAQGLLHFIDHGLRGRGCVLRLLLHHSAFTEQGILMERSSEPNFPQ